MHEGHEIDRILPWVDPTHVDRINLMHRLRASWTVALADTQVTLRLADAPPTGMGTALSLFLWLGDAPVRVRVPPATLAAVLGDRVALSQFNAASPPAQAVWLAYRLADSLDRMSAALGEALRFGGEPVAAPTYDVSLLWHLQQPEHIAVQTIALDLTPAAFDRVARALAHTGTLAPRSLAGLHVPVSVQAGRQRLTLAQCRQLQPGDVVLLEGNADSVRIVAMQALVAAAISTPAGFSLTHPLRPFHEMNESCMTAALASSVLAVTDTDPLDRVPVELICDVARLQMPLGELRVMGVGTVLGANRAMNDCVDIRVNGQRIGRGELVRLGEGLGVRITQLTADD